MTFSEFKDWLLAQDAVRDGRPPDLAQWWELKARLQAVDDAGFASSPAPSDAQPEPALPRPSLAEAQAETTVEDFNPPEDLDPEPAGFRALSRLKDGGLAAEVVDALREQQADLRPNRRA